MGLVHVDWCTYMCRSRMPLLIYCGKSDHVTEKKGNIMESRLTISPVESSVMRGANPRTAKII